MIPVRMDQVRIPEDEVEGLIREIPLEKQVIRTVVVVVVVSRLYSLSF
jgi:hypothetical protein